jgi:hypothetical protein
MRKLLLKQLRPYGYTCAPMPIDKAMNPRMSTITPKIRDCLLIIT